MVLYQLRCALEALAATNLWHTYIQRVEGCGGNSMQFG